MAEANLESMIEELSVWVRTESPTHAPEAVNKMMGLVAAEAESAAISCERIEGRQGLGDTLILRAGPRSDRPGVLVLAHLDTVHPLRTIEHDLPLRREGDRLYGPGVYNMKGGAYLALQAFKAVARSGTAAGSSPRAKELGASTCMWRAVRRTPARATRTGAAPSARWRTRSSPSSG